MLAPGPRATGDGARSRAARAPRRRGRRALALALASLTALWPQPSAAQAWEAGDRRAAADPAADGAGHRPHADAVAGGEAGARGEARRLGSAHDQPARGADGADDAAGADRGVFDPRRRGVARSAARATTTACCSLVAKNDRKMRIEVGYGLEGTLTDVTSRRIIAENVAPLFREGKFAAGIDAGVDRIISVVAEGKPLPPRQAGQRSKHGGRRLRLRHAAAPPVRRRARSSAASCARFSASSRARRSAPGSSAPPPGSSSDRS